MSDSEEKWLRFLKNCVLHSAGWRGVNLAFGGCIFGSVFCCDGRVNPIRPILALLISLGVLGCSRKYSQRLVISLTHLAVKERLPVSFNVVNMAWEKAS